MSALPSHVPYLVVGAGVHGLSTAWWLAEELGPNAGVWIIDKTGPGAGATGIACGVIRDNYYQPAMGEVMRVSREIWESDPDAFGYHPVGYIAAASESMAADLEVVAARHEAVGHPSRLIRGDQQCTTHLRELFPDWQATALTAVLHEDVGGFAFASETVKGLVGKATRAGAQIAEGIELVGIDGNADGVTAVETTAGRVTVDHLVIAVGPWVKRAWQMLGLPDEVDIVAPDGSSSVTSPMWTYWQLQEGEVKVPPFRTSTGSLPPVVHVDSDSPLVSCISGDVISEEPWGIYYKPDHEGVQGGAVPFDLGTDAHVDPYGINSPHYTVDDSFIDYWTAGLGHCMSRFERCHETYNHAASGGIGCFTPDGFPVFDRMLPNVYVIADSNHGFKMIGVGREVAGELLGRPSAVLHPFRFDRYAEGDLHPTSSTPFPWS